MRPRWIALPLGAAFVLAATIAQAGYVYVFDRASYLINPGGRVDVIVSLQETDTTVLRDEGLAGAGVAARFDVPPLPSCPARVLTDSDVVNTSDFPKTWDHSACPALGYAKLLLSAGWNSNVYGQETSPGSGVYRVLLGRFTFTAGTASGETTLVSATDYDPFTSDTITGDFEAIDGLIAGGTIAITTSLYGDANLDGSVNGTDLTAVLSYYNQKIETENWSHGDFNGDGSVNGTDLNALLSFYNQNVSYSVQIAATTAIPEPSTWLLAAIFWSAAIYRRFLRRVK